nr:DUF1461 domain-containing protein [Pseudoalteromonas denitrificans]
MIKIFKNFIIFGYGFSGLVCAFFIAWILMLKLNFLYPSFYSLLEIDKTINQFSPQNHYKKGFEFTSHEQRLLIFSEIVKSVHDDGIGLAQIHYSYINNKNKEQNTLFLHQAEVIHLQDVALLINLLMKLAIGFIVIWLLFIFGFIYQKKPLPDFKSQLILISTFLLSCVLVVLALGAKNVFYWLHTVIFPADNQWFFYYQDSLMTTLMKAPDLFAPISIVLLILAMVVFILIQWLTLKLSYFIHRDFKLN